MFLFPQGVPTSESENTERQIALEYIADAWNGAERDGVEREALAHAALFASLATLVRLFGEEATAQLVSKLPERIQHGEYSLERSIQ